MSLSLFCCFPSLSLSLYLCIYIIDVYTYSYVYTCACIYIYPIMWPTAFPYLLSIISSLISITFDFALSGCCCLPHQSFPDRLLRNMVPHPCAQREQGNKKKHVHKYIHIYMCLIFSVYACIIIHICSYYCSYSPPPMGTPVYATVLASSASSGSFCPSFTVLSAASIRRSALHLISRFPD